MVFCEVAVIDYISEQGCWNLKSKDFFGVKDTKGQRGIHCCSGVLYFTCSHLSDSSCSWLWGKAYVGYPAQLKKSAFLNPTIYDNVDNLENILLSEISQLQKDKHWMIPLIWSIQNSQSLKAESCEGLRGRRNRDCHSTGIKCQLFKIISRDLLQNIVFIVSNTALYT